MTIKEQVREYIKSTLKFGKANPELFIGFLFGFILILVLAGALFTTTVRGPRETISDLAEEKEIELVKELPEEQEFNDQQLDLPVVYQVQAGDSSWKVAKAFYGCGEAYREIEKVNALESDAWLEIGQKLAIPDADNICDAEIKIPDQVRNDIKIGEESSSRYEILEGDCLWSIALEQTGNPYNWVEIYEANKNLIGSNPDLIYPQTNLVIPNSLY